MISYELALGLSFVSVTILAGSMSLVDIVETQGANGFLGWIVWNLSQPLAFIIFLIAGMAETNRSPFDMPEAEQELTAGYHTEYSGMKFALFFMAEYIKIIAVSMIASTLFLGGYLGPFVDPTALAGTNLPVYQDTHHDLHFHLGPGNFPTLQIRPADGIWMEGAAPIGIP